MRRCYQRENCVCWGCTLVAAHTALRAGAVTWVVWASPIREGKLATLHTAGRLKLDNGCGPFLPRPFYDPMLCKYWFLQAVTHEYLFLFA